MVITRRITWSLALAAAVALGCSSCGGTGDATDAGADSNTDTGADAASATDAGADAKPDDAAGTPSGVAIHLKDFISRGPLAGAVCELVDDNGTPLDPPLLATSNSTGWCFIYPSQPIQLYSAKITLASYLDAYIFHRYQRPVDSEGHLWGFNITLYTADQISTIATDVGLTFDSAKGYVDGQVWWSRKAPSSAAGSGQPVGCAVITPALSNLYYMDSTTWAPDTSLTQTLAHYGGWGVVNAEPGPVTFTATVDGLTRDSGQVVVFANAVTYPSVTFLEEDYPTNPTPSGCP